MSKKTAMIAAGVVIAVIIVIFAFWRPFSNDVNEGAGNTTSNIPVPGLIDTPGDLDKNPLPPIADDPNQRPTDSRSPNEARVGSRNSEEEAKWSASSKGFSTNFGIPDENIDVFLDRIRPFATPELIGRMKTIAPENMVSGTWSGDAVLEYRDTDIFVESAYQEGWSIKLHISKQGDGNWLVDTYTRG